MRFKPWPRPTPFEDTPRKRAAYARKCVRERDALPLFAEAVAQHQLPVSEEMVRRIGIQECREVTGRGQRAAAWRRARARLFAFADPDRRAIRALWRVCPYPADPSYLATLLHEIETGRIDPAHSPWGRAWTPPPRPAPPPEAGFADVFRQIGACRVGGGPKATGADELLFCGNLGAGIVFLTSRVRLCDPSESFMTSSGHRLRDGHVGRAGHWVEIRVRGDCSDADLARIRRLAEAVDERPVMVRRA